MLPTSTDVLIVGAGPTGLALAASLRQAGVDHLLIDRLAEGQSTSRAAVIHAHTLETLADIGVTDALVERGIRIDRFTLRDRDRQLMSLRFGSLPSPHPYLLMVPQDVTERVLADRLVALGGRVHRGVEATAITRDGDGARIAVNGPEGPLTIAARYVVGADGMHSRVREAAGIAFEGSAYAESFVLADVRMDWPLGAEVSLSFAPEGMMVVAPLPGGAFRIVATLDAAPETPAVADVQALVDGRGPSSAGAVREVLWSSRFRIHHRIARSYRSGPFLLMGDAAHVHSPAGGQGMNTGLVDAIVLGHRLSDVISGDRPDAWLDGYGALRRPAAAAVLKLADRLTAMATTRSQSGRALRNVALSLADALPSARRRIELNLSGLARRDLATLAA